MARKFLHGCRGIYCREQADLSRLEMALESETPARSRRRCKCDRSLLPKMILGGKAADRCWNRLADIAVRGRGFGVCVTEHAGGNIAINIDQHIEQLGLGVSENFHGAFINEVAQSQHVVAQIIWQFGVCFAQIRLENGPETLIKPDCVDQGIFILGIIFSQ